MREYRAADYFTNGVDLYVNKHVKRVGSKNILHTHDFAELAYIYSGSGTHIIDGKRYHVEKGSLLFINYNQSHEVIIEKSLTQIDIQLSPKFISRELVDTKNFLDILTLSQFGDLHDFIDAELSYINLAGGELIFAESVLDRINDEFHNKRLGYESIIRGCLQIVFSVMVRQLTGNTAGVPKHLNEILDFIDKNYNEVLTAEMLSEKCFYNPAYFGRIFNECYGMSFRQYIRKRRIDEAMRLLRDTRLSIDEIINAVGYSNRSNFYRVFIEQFGKSPADIRNMQKGY